MSTPILLSVFQEGLSEPRGAHMTKSWEDIAGFIGKPLPDHGKPKTACTLWAFAAYPEDTYAEGQGVELGALVLDYDADPTIGAERLEELWSDVAFAAHTTYSSGRPKRDAPPMPRWRAILPLKRAVNVREYADLVTWAKLRSPTVSDGRPGQRYIMPLARMGSTADLTYGCLVQEGPWLDPDQCIRDVTRVRAQSGQREHLQRLKERGALPIADLLTDALSVLDDRSRGLEPPIPVPWSALEGALEGGLRPGIHLLTGVPGSGRTQVALELAMCAAQAYVPTLFVGLSVGPQQLITRAVGLVSGTPWSTLWNGPDPKVMEEARAHATALAGLPLSLQTASRGGWGADRVYDYAEAFAAAHETRPFLFVLDGVQLLAAPGNTPTIDRRQRVLRAIAEARAAVQNLGAVILMVSHTNHRHAVGDATPSHDGLGRDPELRELEAAADTVIPIVAEEAGVALAVAKARATDAAPGAWIHLRREGGRYVEG